MGRVMKWWVMRWVAECFSRASFIPWAKAVVVELLSYPRGDTTQMTQWRMAQMTARPAATIKKAKPRS